MFRRRAIPRVREEGRDEGARKGHSELRRSPPPRLRADDLSPHDGERQGSYAALRLAVISLRLTRHSAI
jgi:hypothetical protein